MASSSISVDESELLNCLKRLTKLSHHDDDDSLVDKSTNDSGDNDEDFESNEEYQALVKEVEAKLIEFLENQVPIQRDPPISIASNAVASVQPPLLPIHKPHAYPCSSTHVALPSPPENWPQRPVMIRPTPGTSTKIRGIRYVRDDVYRHFSGFCAGCILPFNTGKEASGKSLVVDFESNQFVGTMLMRIRDTTPVEGSRQGESDYFDKRKRRFQGIIKGKFKTPLRMSECVTGQVFSRRAGKLPAQWVVSTFIKFVASLAPQLSTTIDGDNPRFLVPLAATAHTVQAKPFTSPISSQATNDLKDKVADDLYNYTLYQGSKDIDQEVTEPPATDDTSIMQDVHRDHSVNTSSSKSSVSSRMKMRKKAFNTVSAKRSDKPCFSLDKEYTFEFYQHMLIFHEPEFVLDMGRPIGKIPLSAVTDGQPIKFMSAHKDPDTGKLDSLWSFDIWHESMYALAKEAEKRVASVPE